MPIITITITPRSWGIHEPWHDVNVPIRFRKGDNFGIPCYYVERSDTGHKLGIVYPPHRYRSLPNEGWSSYISNSAYYPVDADLMVPSHPNHRGDTVKMEKVAEGFRTREEATSEMLWTLSQRRAEGLEDLVEAVRNAAGFGDGSRRVVCKNTLHIEEVGS